MPEKAFLEGIRTDMVLNDEIEILEDEEVDIQEMPEDIDEIGWIEVKDKINEIIRVVNKMQLDKK